MKYKNKTLTDELNGTTKKKYVSPSLRLCQALSLKCEMNQGPASAGAEIDENTPVEEGGDFELSKRRFYNSDFYSGYDKDY